jgi:hypothetical protein
MPTEKKRIPNVQRKKSFEVLPMKGDLMGIGVGGKMRKFGKDARAMVIHDEGEANAIEQMYGSHSKTGDSSVVVVEVDDSRPENRDRDGRAARASFVINAPWKKGEEDGDTES